ncbi:MAG: universal stress protein [Richelia sp. RM2_1_2]|nr:universal stress protein [Richelia sp. SM1_7_0]NJN10012.1 universal stress protein [Richelia sp. RM1_1_1]NJO28226.1 universal stress protein [Richelia sp. SL_2_1]NJO60123.1 universal stress protein [Richelia sp. RM2_1_2]
MEQILQEIQKSPIVAFTILLLVILIVPPIFERLRLPGLVGLLTAGIFLGPDGLGVLNAESETMKLLSDIGKIYLMFVAGLEIDLEDFRRTKNRSLGFGIATFLIPLIFGMTVGRFFDFGWNASILIGSLLASHTLLGFPIITRLGVTSNQAVTVTIGATIFTDIAALLVLAICVSVSDGEFSIASVVMQLAILAIYSAVILFGFDWAGKEYFRRTGDEQSNQFLFVLLAVFLASVGAQIVNVDRIVGAFLAGLAVNDVVGHSPVEEKVEFVGSTLFIPFFFINMGLLIDLAGFISSLTSELLLTLGIVGALISSKFLAAFTAKLLYGYNWNETLTMWSLSLPQVAATLAAALVGKNAGIITDSVFNTIIVLMLVTAILGPVLTEKFGRNLKVPQANLQKNPQKHEVETENVDLNLDNDNFIYQNLFKVIVPIYNPNTARYLIEMGALLAHHEKGIIVPLSIPKAHVYMDEPELKVSIKRSKLLLQQAITISEEFQAQAQPLIRIDDDLARGISRAAREQNADLIVMGWSPNSSLQARLFGNIIDNVFWSAHCPVAVMRLLDEPINIHRILVPVRSITPQILRVIQFAQLFADTNEAAVTLLQVCPRKTTDQEIALFESELSSLLNQSKSRQEVLIQTIRQDDVAKVIINQASSYDMLILRSFRRRTAGGLAVSDVTSKVLSSVSCSLVLFGEPNSG